MGKITGAAISPHPPIILPIVGGGREREASTTITGMKKMAKEAARKKPDTIILITPHGTVFRDAHSIVMEKELSGDFTSFGVGDSSQKYEIDIELGEKILAKSREKNIPLLRINREFMKKYGEELSLDWGVLVPMYYIDQEIESVKILPMAYGLLDGKEMEKMGEVLKEAIEEREGSVMILASGDLSHALKDSGPYSYNSQGPVFDKKIKELVEQGDFQGIIDFNKKISDPAAECGLRSFQIMAGALKEKNVKPEVFSYEGPFGVGYMTAFIDVEEE